MGYNFWDRRNKKKILADIKNYGISYLPLKFRPDPEVIDGVLKYRPEDITKLTWEEAQPRIDKNPSYLNYYDEKFRLELSQREPKYLDFLKPEELLKLIVDYRKHQYISRLSNDVQRSILEENFSRYDSSLQNFNFDVILSMIRDNVKKRTHDNSADILFKYHISKLDISIFSAEQQLAILTADKTFLEKVPLEVLKLYVNDNPYLIKELPDYLREKYRDMSKFSYSNSYKLLSERYGLNDYELDDIKRFLARSFQNFNLNIIANHSNLVDWPDLARFDSRTVAVVNNSNSVGNVKKMFSLANLYKKELDKYSMTGELKAYFDTSNGDQFLYRMDYRENNFNQRFNQIHKIILNERIMSRCDKRAILDFIKNPFENVALKSLVETAYGKEASDILGERSGITIAEIPTFDIFDETVFNNFGKGVIHNVLSYNSKTGNIIGELVRNKEKFTRFLRYRELTKGYYQNTALDNDEQLKDFLDIDQEFKGKIDLFTLGDGEVANLVLFLIDRFGSAYSNEGIKINSLEELREYPTKRNALLDEAMSKTNDPRQAKNYLFMKYFGMPYATEEQVFRPQKSDAIRMLSKYNIKSFVDDDRTIKSDVFSSDELDMLKIAEIIASIGDIEVIRDMYNVLGEKTDILTPVDFKAVRSKVPGIYSQALVDSLLKKEQMDKMISDGVEGISKRVEDDVEIVTLDGADFRIFMHTTGVNNSEIRLPEDERPYSTLKLIDKWNTLEQGGVSTISGSVIEPKMLDSCVGESNVNLGFSDFGPELVLGMGFGDINVTHDRRELDVYFKETGPALKFDYPEELVRKTAAQINNVLGTPKDYAHPYNEVTISRRETNPDNIRDDTYGGRVNPDYIILYGTKNPLLEEAKDLARRFKKDGENIPIIQIDIDKYQELGNSYQRAHQGYNPTPTLVKESHFLEVVREVGKAR